MLHTTRTHGRNYQKLDKERAAIRGADAISSAYGLTQNSNFGAYQGSSSTSDDTPSTSASADDSYLTTSRYVDEDAYQEGNSSASGLASSSLATADDSIPSTVGYFHNDVANNFAPLHSNNYISDAYIHFSPLDTSCGSVDTDEQSEPECMPMKEVKVNEKYCEVFSMEDLQVIKTLFADLIVKKIACHTTNCESEVRRCHSQTERAALFKIRYLKKKL